METTDVSYDTLKLIHSLAAYVWLGSLFGTLIFTTLSTRRSSAGAIVGATAIVRFSTRVGLPAAVVLLVAGLWMTSTGDVKLGSPWISIGFVTWLIAALVGSGLQHPAARKMRNADAGSAEALRMARRIVLIGGVQIIVLVVAIWVMGAKPGS